MKDAISKTVLLLSALAWVLFVACSDADKPEPINRNEDVCAQCSMTITDVKYACELFEGAIVRKFDDLMCMANYIRDKGLSAETSRIWVTDFDSQEWVRGQEAFYVRSSEIRSPMASGLAAFKYREVAQRFAGSTKGEIITFNEMLGAKLPQAH